MSSLSSPRTRGSGGTFLSRFHILYVRFQLGNSIILASNCLLSELIENLKARDARKFIDFPSFCHFRGVAVVLDSENGTVLVHFRYTFEC
jgi:hypothetical protein